jgi:hypothetical protein
MMFLVFLMGSDQWTLIYFVAFCCKVAASVESGQSSSGKLG